jgi:hypothetical protein
MDNSRSDTHLLGAEKHPCLSIDASRTITGVPTLKVSHRELSGDLACLTSKRVEGGHDHEQQ